MKPLRAGALSLLYGDGMIRNVRWGNIPILHSIYAAVRDRNWGTVPGVLTLREQSINADDFHIVFEMRHQRDEIDFSWVGTITGDSAGDSLGKCVFEFDGVANSTFESNRIGFCVLHPASAAGQACFIEHTDSSLKESHFPRLISPYQPFFDIRAIGHEFAAGIRSVVEMDGDVFEMEDQRNWTDASFKTYCRPLALPFPFPMEAGTRVRQQIRTLVTDLKHLPSNSSFRTTSAQEKITVTLGNKVLPMPAIGLAVASHGEPLSETQVARLRELNLSHLRAEVRLYESGGFAAFERAVSESRLLSVPLELAVFVNGDADAHLKALASWIDLHQPEIKHLAIFTKPGKHTEEAHANLARKHLGRFGFPIGGGTDAFFTEFNRLGAPVRDLDFITYSINPQVHAFDNLSLVETLAMHASTIETARYQLALQGSGHLPIHVSPVTLKMRWNPNATSPDPEPPPGVLPTRVDPRQSSLFGAGWTLGSIKYLAEAGTDSVTYYETTGWLGVMATESGSPLPDQFHDTPGGVYPMWHVFKRIGGGEVIESKSSDSFKVEVLATLQGRADPCIMLANLTAEAQTVEFTYPHDRVGVLWLDEATFSPAGRETMTFIHSSQMTDKDEHLFKISLHPNGLAFLNVP